MKDSSTMNGLFRRLPPPSTRRLEVQDKLWLILQLIWINILTVPYILISIVRTLVPRRGKCLRGQVVVVTGAGRGIGWGLAMGFADEGCKVAVVDINRKGADDTAAQIVGKGGVAKAYYTNIAKVEEVKALEKAVVVDLGPVDIVVNNAALIVNSPLDDNTEDEIRGVLSVNLLSHFWMARTFLPEMKKRRSGHLVAIASTGSLSGEANATAYIASKFGLRGFMEALRLEVRKEVGDAVKITTVCPYFTNTSSYYIDRWHLRFPARSIDEVVKRTIAGVKRQEVLVTVPPRYLILLALFRILPQYIQDLYREGVFYTHVCGQTEQEKSADPNFVIAREMGKA